MVKGARAKGSSGHTADFAYAVRAAGSTALTYIEPIALKAGKKMDWTQVYQTHGKMSDVKMADARNSRMVILEDGASAEEFKKAVAILSSPPPCRRWPRRATGARSSRTERGAPSGRNAGQAIDDFAAMQYRGVHRLARTVDIAAVGEARNRIFVAAILHGARLDHGDRCDEDGAAGQRLTSAPAPRDTLAVRRYPL